MWFVGFPGESLWPSYEGDGDVAARMPKKLWTTLGGFADNLAFIEVPDSDEYRRAVSRRGRRADGRASGNSGQGTTKPQTRRGRYMYMGTCSATQRNRPLRSPAPTHSHQNAKAPKTDPQARVWRGWKLVCTCMNLSAVSLQPWMHVACPPSHRTITNMGVA